MEDHAPVLFELRDVCYRRAGRTVLDSVSADIHAGATAIVGPSGSGKSTLLRLLNRLADPDRGTISYRGRMLADYEPLALRREVSLVPQLPSLLAGSVGTNLAFAAELAGRALDVERCLRLAELDASFAERDVAELSIGEQQRAMLARCLSQEPDVLLLDEPTSALDHEARDAIEQTLVGLRRDLDVSLVVVSHDPAQATRLADRTLRIEDGTIAAADRLESAAR